ncbi:MAG: transposase [Microcystis aeruginosa]
MASPARYGADNWVDVDQRQLCWAHLKREFTKISERQGLSRQLGRDLLAQQKKLFRLWQRVRDGTLSRSEFQSLVSPIQARVRSLLEQGAAYQISSKEKTQESENRSHLPATAESGASPVAVRHGRGTGARLLTLCLFE